MEVSLSQIIEFENLVLEFLEEVKDERLMLPHSLLADECNDVLFVADRKSGDVFVFQLSDFNSTKGPTRILFFVYCFYILYCRLLIAQWRSDHGLDKRSI